MPASMLRRPKLDVSLFARRNGTVRLGWEPERSFIVTPPLGVDPAVLVDLLRRLDGVHSRAHTIWYAGTVGMSANAMSTLLGELTDSGLLVEGAVEPAPDGPPGTSVVHLLGQGPIADAVAAGSIPTSRVVLRRASAVPPHRIGPDHALTQCDVAVLADDMAPDPQVVTALVLARTPHLLVRVREGRGVVGPFVVPGIGSCLRCADLTRCSLDPEWPHVSAQLLGRVGSASRPTILAASALALAQLDAFVETGSTPLLNTTVEIDATSAFTTRRSWSPHPLCDCTG